MGRESLSINGQLGRMSTSGAEILSLSNQRGKKQFGQAVDSAHGEALVVVHPYYHEIPGLKSEDQDGYKEYQAYLRRTVQVSTQNGVPLVVFEEFDSLYLLPRTLLRMGNAGSKVFVLPTVDGSPEPFEAKHNGLSGLSDQLKDEGLQRAIVNGSYLWLSSPITRNSISPNEISPSNPPKVRLAGCVGHTVNVLNANGILAEAGEASYPGSKWPQA